MRCVVNNKLMLYFMIFSTFSSLDGAIYNRLVCLFHIRVNFNGFFINLPHHANALLHRNFVYRTSICQKHDDIRLHVLHTMTFGIILRWFQAARQNNERNLRRKNGETFNFATDYDASNTAYKFHSNSIENGEKKLDRLLFLLLLLLQSLSILMH